MLDRLDGAVEDGGSHFPVCVFVGVSEVCDAVVETGDVVEEFEHFKPKK